jgi:hypothetical protein
MVSGGFRPGADQNNPTKVSATGGNGQSGKFVAQKVAKATQLRPSGFPQGQNTAMAQQISEGGNVATTANAANPASELPTSNMNLSNFMSAIEPIDAEPTEYLPISDGIDFGRGRGREAVSPRVTSAINQTEGVDMIKRYLPDLMNATRLQGAPDSYKKFVNFLKAQIL